MSLEKDKDFKVEVEKMDDGTEISRIVHLKKSKSQEKREAIQKEAEQKDKK